MCAVRLDSGDLDELSGDPCTARHRGLSRSEIFASSGLDENRIAALLAACPLSIDGFGVGTRSSWLKTRPRWT